MRWPELGLRVTAVLLASEPVSGNRAQAGEGSATGGEAVKGDLPPTSGSF